MVRRSDLQLLRREGLLRPLCASLGGHLLLLGLLWAIPGSLREPEVLMVELALPQVMEGGNRGRATPAQGPPVGRRTAAPSPAVPQPALRTPLAVRQPAVVEPHPPAPAAITAETSHPLPVAASNPAAAAPGGGGQGAAGAPASGGRGEEGGGSGAGPSSGPVREGVFGTTDGPAFLERISPVYPRLAQRLGKEGTVLLRLAIDARGTLTAVEVVERGGHGFDEAALAAVRGSRFRPARQGGVAVPCRALLPIQFKLGR